MVEPVFNFTAESLSLKDESSLIRVLSSDGLLVMERIVRGRLATLCANVGQSIVNGLDGLVGETEAAAQFSEEAQKFKHFLEVLDSLKNGTQVVEKLKNV